MHKKLLIVAAIICLVAANCDVNTFVANIQSGSVTLQSANQARQFFDQQYEHPFNVTFSQVPKAIFALQGFFSRSSMITQWNILPSEITRTRMSFKFHHQGSEWNSITLGFWISAREDIELGNIEESMDNTITKSFIFQRNFNPKIPTNNQTIIRTFLNGYISEKRGYVDLKFVHQLTQVSKAKFILQTGDMSLKKIYLSYLVYNAGTAGFKSYGGGKSGQSVQGSMLMNFQKIFQETPYSIHGLISAKFQNAVNFRFNTSLDDQFFFRVDSSGMFEQFTILFIAIGVSPAVNCEHCQNKYIRKGECVSSCSSDEYEVEYGDGAKGCRYCSAEYGYMISNARNGCTCFPGLTLGANGFCVRSQNQTVTTSTITSVSNSNTSTGASTQAVVQSKPNITGNTVDASKNNGNSNQNSITTQTSQINSIQVSNALSSFSQSSQPLSSFSTPTTLPTETNSGNNNLSNTNSQFSTAYSNPTGFSTTPTATSNTYFNNFATQPTSTTFIPGTQNQNIGQQKCILPNTFFNGIQCACRPGYMKNNGLCSPLIEDDYLMIPSQFIDNLAAYHNHNNINECSNDNQIFDGQTCICKAGYQRNSSGICTPKLQCSQNQTMINNKCQCKPDYILYNNRCVKTITCPDNAYFNGAECVCNFNYYLFNGRCIQGVKCQQDNMVYVNGQCVCIQSYFLYNGVCVKCPAGKYYVNGSCVVLCGSNEVVSANGSCICREGYGKYTNNICNICPNTTQLVNGYCVSCPIGSLYNPQTFKCDCLQGYFLNQYGFCKSRCLINQQFKAISQKCVCRSGFGRINGICQECSVGSIDPITGNCYPGCRFNQVLLGNRCVCRAGTGYYNGNCVICEVSVEGGFLVDGYCAICPKGQIAGPSNRCSCPLGQTLINGICQSNCLPHQLVDEFGYCYECPIMQIPENGVCVCRPGYQRINNICTLSCANFEIPGSYRCGLCPLSTHWDENLQICVCPQGFYKNIYGVCVPSQFVPIDCPDGKYFDSKEGCLNCPQECSKCTNPNLCIACSSVGFVPLFGKCVSKCGDGIVVAGQQCDDGNQISKDGCSSSCQIQKYIPKCGDGIITIAQQCDDNNTIAQDGCSNCKIDIGYNCSGSPSKCIRNSTSSNITLYSTPLYNMINIYVNLQTNKIYLFSSDDQMRSFIKFNFPDKTTIPDQVYCLQQAYSPRNFRCLLVYNAGIPNKIFDADFSYNFKGDTGFIRVPLNPLKSAFSSRSLQ